MLRYDSVDKNNGGSDLDAWENPSKYTALHNLPDSSPVGELLEFSCQIHHLYNGLFLLVGHGCFDVRPNYCCRLVEDRIMKGPRV